MTKPLQMINICIYIFGEKEHWDMGHFKMFQGRRDISIIWETGNSILWERGHFILWDMGNSSLRERFHPLGIGPLILWESDHLFSGIQDILWGTGHGKQDRLSSRIRTTNPLGNIGNWEMDLTHDDNNFVWDMFKMPQKMLKKWWKMVKITCERWSK